MNDEGFTYPELLVSLAITGIISFLLMGTFFSFSTFMVRSGESSRNSRQTLLSYYYLKEEVGRVRPDWRDSNLPYIKSGNEYRFFRFRGEKGRVLILRNTDEELRILEQSNGEESVIHRLEGVNILKITPLYTSGLLHALQVRVLSGKREEIFVLPLSVIPVKGEV